MEELPVFFHLNHLFKLILKYNTYNVIYKYNVHRYLQLFNKTHQCTKTLNRLFYSKYPFEIQ